MNEDLYALVSYRLDEAHESLEEAVLLLESHNPRGALSRTYYAMFYATLALLTTKDMVLPSIQE